MLMLLLLGAGLFAQPEAAGAPQAVAKSSVLFEKPVWSPDGETLTFSSAIDKSLWEVSKNGGNLRKVPAQAGIRRQSANSPALLQQMISDPVGVTKKVSGLAELSGYMVTLPVLSPSGEYIVFQASMGRGTFICNAADGTGLRQIAQKGINSTWTACEKYIVMMSLEDDGHTTTASSLVAVEVATGAQTPLFASKTILACNPVISPDGKKIAFADMNDGTIYVMDIK